ncbi:NAD(P)/FAD-dependent oxidoreductase [Pinirhizobacter sp.]|jgi:cation diffusion facilitator CzcD-associated flavoprotein CzcO|uniref:flavin-containing monooxygenase n=1 Tax=Pinirhizobacter sp. TaxID=2950432 RepID=UPI002F3F0C98
MGERFDVVIIGAGLAGIGMACHLAREHPGKRVALIERRQRLGGTWDLFKFPGIRSDSDVFSFGYAFRPWQSPTMMADGESIRQYIQDAAREYSVEEKIHCGLRVQRAEWSSADGAWTLHALHEATGELQVFEARYLVSCTGYYDYDAGYQPSFPGQEHFTGTIVHPQHWPSDLNYAGKNVVVVGSGATAVTIVPAMTDKAAHVTMLQRSPSYIISLPGVDPISKLLGHVLPKAVVHRMSRRVMIGIQRGLYIACRRWPKGMRRLLVAQMRQYAGKGMDMRHFTPAYMPWDERVCVVPDADLFKAIKAGKVSMATDRIDTFTPTGIRLASGQELPADIVVSATGLTIQVLGGMQVRVDGVLQPLRDRMLYKAVLVQDMPNFACVIGYANAPWTLKADLAAAYVCRLLTHMDTHGAVVATPRDLDGAAAEGNVLGQLTAGYVRRGDAVMPRQGRAYPWAVEHHYGRDRRMLVAGPIADRWLEIR